MPSAISLVFVLTPLVSTLATRQATPPTVLGGAFSAAHLEQLVAPVALYPDAVLAQVLMASTYPVEIMEAAMWIQANPKPAGADLDTALRGQTWDPSVKSLCGFSGVLQRMCQHLDWAQDLGDAFLEQKSEVLDTVQSMRRKAFDAGNLRSSGAFAVTERADKIVILDEADPVLIFVPTYYPQAMYGGWSFPSWYYPNLYAAPPASQSWYSSGAGFVWQGALWGGCSWGTGGCDVNVDVSRRNRFMERTELDARQQKVNDRASNSVAWQHDPAHRRGVGYRDARMANKYGGSASESRVSREKARLDAERATKARAEAHQQAFEAAVLGAAVKGHSSGAFSGSQSADSYRANSARGSYSQGFYGTGFGFGRWGRYYGPRVAPTIAS